MTTISANRVSNTGAATEIETKAFFRQALAAAAFALGTGKLVLKGENGKTIELSKTDLQLIAMGKKPVPEGVDSQALALFCDDLASQKAKAKIENQQVSVDIAAAGL